MSSENANQANGQPAPTGQAVATLPTFGQLLGTSDQPRMCSWDLTTPEGRELLQKCDETPDEKVRELINTEFLVKHIYCKVVDYHDEKTDTVRPILRICLVTPEGKVHATSSDGVRESIVRLSMGRGFPPWENPVPVRVVQKATKGERVRLVLLEVFSPKKEGSKK